MLSWHNLPRASFDLETTGRDPQSARIVTASIILVDAAGNVLEHHEWLVDPGVEIPEEAAAIHGVTTAQAQRDGLPSGTAVAQIIHVLNGFFGAGVPVLAFNASYDFTVLAREAERVGLTAPVPFPVIDPYIMDKQADRYRRGKRTLTAMAEHYGVSFENAHTSAADVMATLAVGSAMANAFPVLAQECTALHQQQVGWAAEQAASFQSYLRRRDPEAVIDGAWPVKAAPAAVPVAVPQPASAGVVDGADAIDAADAAPAARPMRSLAGTVPLLVEEAGGQLSLALSGDTAVPA